MEHQLNSWFYFPLHVWNILIGTVFMRSQKHFQEISSINHPWVYDETFEQVFDSSTFFDVRIHLFNGYQISRLFLSRGFVYILMKIKWVTFCVRHRGWLWWMKAIVINFFSYVCSCITPWSIITLSITLRIHSKYVKMLNKV